MRIYKLLALTVMMFLSCAILFAPKGSAARSATATAFDQLDDDLSAALTEAGFTGNIEATLEQRLGRPINQKRAELGRLLFFDPVLSLHQDSSCASCHSPTTGFGDTQAIAIGINNNGFVGPDRGGPRNQRRAPTVINAAFYPNLMWNSRFVALSGDPFDNSNGFSFPEPEGRSLSRLPHLLAAQAFIPPTVAVEMTGFDFQGDSFAVRDEVLRRVTAIKKYRKLFKKAFPEVKRGAPVTYDMIGEAIAEFEFTLVFANAPLDRFARGETTAMTEKQKRGALLFFGKAQCITCHAVSGQSNEMFSDFTPRVVGVPQIVPMVSNVKFDGPGMDEDFGLEQVTGDAADRYKFRTAPLRNLSVQSAFFHNGVFSSLYDTIQHYRHVFESARSFEGARRETFFAGPIEPVLERVPDILNPGIQINDEEFEEVLEFVRNGLLDPRARPENLRSLIPDSVPSGLPLPVFEQPNF